MEVWEKQNSLQWTIIFYFPDCYEFVCWAGDVIAIMIFSTIFLFLKFFLTYLCRIPWCLRNLQLFNKHNRCYTFIFKSVLWVTDASAPYWFDHNFLIDTQYQCEFISDYVDLFICTPAAANHWFLDHFWGSCRVFGYYGFYVGCDAPNIDVGRLSRRRTDS